MACKVCSAWEDPREIQGMHSLAVMVLTPECSPLLDFRWMKISDERWHSHQVMEAFGRGLNAVESD